MADQVTLKKRAIKALENINDPFIPTLKRQYIIQQGILSYGKGRSGQRISLSDYRITYEILDEKLLIDVIEPGHRRGIHEYNSPYFLFQKKN